MGFPMGEEIPYSERELGIGARWVPSPRGRRGCMLMLIAGLIVIVLALVLAVAFGTL